MADGGHHGQADRLGVERLAGRAAPDPPTASQGGVGGDGRGSARRTGRKQLGDGVGEGGLERDIEVGPVTGRKSAMRWLSARAWRALHSPDCGFESLRPGRRIVGPMGEEVYGGRP